MKPLPSAPLTKEDSWIWGFASYPRDLANSRFARSLYGESMERDHRDAELMLERQRHLAEPSGDGTLERPVRMYQTVKSWWLLPLERHE